MGQLAPLQLKSASSKVNLNHERSSTRVYTGYFTLDCDENFVRLNAAVIRGSSVGITDPHPTDSYQFVTDISAALSHPENMTFYDDSQGQQYTEYNGFPCLYWEITIEFGPFNPLEQSVSGNMIDMPIRYRFEPEDDEVPIFQDLSGTDNTDLADPTTTTTTTTGTTPTNNGNNGGVPICNSAGDYFNPGINRLIAKRRLIVLRNEANPDWYSLQKNEYCTNNATWNNYPKDTVLLKPVRTPVTKFCQVTGSYYQEMEYTLEIRLQTWHKYVLDQGFKKLVKDPTTGNLVQVAITDEGGVPITEQTALDGNGGVLQQPITPSNLVLLGFQIYNTVDFSFLKMDNLFTQGVGA